MILYSSILNCFAQEAEYTTSKNDNWFCVIKNEFCLYQKIYITKLKYKIDSRVRM